MIPTETKRTIPEPKIESRAEPAETHVAVVGLGYVGLPLALLAKRRGYRVTGFDIDLRKVESIRARSVPFLVGEDADLLLRYGLPATADESALAEANIFIVCVPTPVSGDHEPDLAPLLGASEIVGRSVKEGDLVIIESTVSPGVCEAASLAAIERVSGLTGGADFSFAHCPERINPGDETWDVGTIPRVVGALDSRSLARAMRFYESILRAPLFPMASVKEAEAVKMVENAFRDINIAFVNELAMSFQKAGIDLTNVLAGASTKPFGFVAHMPGCGVGGHCIPVDPYYLIRYGRENGFEHQFLITARKINNRMPLYTVELLGDALKSSGKSLEGATVALLGLAYKRDVPDMRESPALAILDELGKAGAEVRVFDPYVPEESTVTSLEEALAGADAALIATDHQVFRELSPADFLEHDVDVLIDGRNCLPKEEFLAQGLTYRGIGR